MKRVYCYAIVFVFNFGILQPMGLGNDESTDRLAGYKTAVDSVKAGQDNNLIKIGHLGHDIAKFQTQKSEAETLIRRLKLSNDLLAANNPNNQNASEIEQNNRKIEQADRDKVAAEKALNDKDPNHDGDPKTNKGLLEKLNDEVHTRESLKNEHATAQKNLKNAIARDQTATDLKAHNEVGDHTSSEGRAGARVREAEALRSAAKNLESDNYELAKAMNERAAEIEGKVDQIAAAAKERDGADTHYPKGDIDGFMGDNARKQYSQAVDDLAKMEPWKPGQSTEPQQSSNNNALATSADSTANSQSGLKTAYNELPSVPDRQHHSYENEIKPISKQERLEQIQKDVEFNKKGLLESGDPGGEGPSGRAWEKRLKQAENELGNTAAGTDLPRTEKTKTPGGYLVEKQKLWDPDEREFKEYNVWTDKSGKQFANKWDQNGNSVDQYVKSKNLSELYHVEGSVAVGGAKRDTATGQISFNNTNRVMSNGSLMNGQPYWRPDKINTPNANGGTPLGAHVGFKPSETSTHPSAAAPNASLPKWVQKFFNFFYDRGKELGN